MTRLRILCVLLLLPIGCTYQQPGTEIVPESYPVRDDFLVRSAPKPTPSGWYQPGFPPLVLLRQPPDTFSDDTKALQREVGSSINDARKLEKEARTSFADALTQLFGTPSQPKIEPVSSEIQQAITELRLDSASIIKGGEVFRKNCMDCHGLTGNGDGPGARGLVPLPRDYRQGIFKFISSDDPNSAAVPKDRCGPKARRGDLRGTIVRGIDGSMPAFVLLSEDEIDAVISHVIYLAIRGEAEYLTMLAWVREENEEDEVIDEMKLNLQTIVPRWLKAERAPIVVEPDPYLTDEQQLAAASNGYALFYTIGGCTACHKDYGRNSPFVYDAWAGINRARNLPLGQFRGGRDGESIYTRLYIGIAGSGMPAHHTLLKSTPEDIEAGRNKLWEMTHFVRALSEPQKRLALQTRYGVKLD